MPKAAVPITRAVYTTRKKSTEDLYKEIVELKKNENLSCRDIADKLGVGKSTVSRHLAEFGKSCPSRKKSHVAGLRR